MEITVLNPQNQKPSINPWLLILITAVVPALLFVVVFIKWYREKTDFKRIQSYFVQRQNKVLAFDAMEVATGFGDLLEKAGRDVQILALFPPSPEGFSKFYLAQMGDFTRYDIKNDAVLEEPLPFYNRVAIHNPAGDLVLALQDGKKDPRARSLANCKLADLCDPVFLKKATELPPGEMLYGKILRYFTNEGVPEDDAGAGLSVAYRARNGIYILTIDYKHLKDHLTTPTFPYDPKRNLLDAYQKGNYIYITDSMDDIVTHPHYWKAAGISKETGTWVTPMKEDKDAGRHPINIRLYENGILKEYFERLIKVSFQQKGVDIFQAPNLKGTNRILSVAPIQVSKGQFSENNVFGHVIVACNVDYFEEPAEMLVPYY